MDCKILNIITVADLTWRSGLEYALDGVSKASHAGVALKYEIIGNGPMLEALGFAIHEMELSEHSKITNKIDRRFQADVFLLPAVASVSQVYIRSSLSERMKWITTNFMCLENYVTKENVIQVPRWDSQSIADVLISIYQRKIN
jgi:glycosyltransferase involved in cell wall biosynthesis